MNRKAFCGVVCLISLMSGAAVWAAGLPEDALYPSGAPGPVMKTLNQIEPRTAITAAGTLITQPGSYYLTAPLSATYSHGVKIQADNVSLDLGGFSLKGARASGFFGIYVEGATNAVLRNIVVRGGGISGFDVGFRADFVQSCCFEQLTITSNLTTGVMLNGGGGQCSGNVVRECVIGKNDDYGISLSAFSGICNANEIRDCQIFDNGESGIYAMAHANGQVCETVIEGCAIQNNHSYGLLLNGSSGQCSGNRIEACSVNGNGSYGLYLTSAGGKCVGNNILRNCFYQNTAYGIRLNGANNNMIANNHVLATVLATGVSAGIWTANSASNIVVQNSCSGQLSNYVFNATDTYGPVVTNKGALATSGTAMHPWANFSR